MNWRWVCDLAIAVVAGVYFETLWDRHSAETLKIPERRTLYDFFHTHPRAFWAMLSLIAALVDAARHDNL